MGLLDRLRRRKKTGILDEPSFPAGYPETAATAAYAPVAYVSTAPAVPTSAATSSLKAEMDLILSQMENLRMQYEAIGARLQNIERIVAEIRSFCK